MLAVTITALFRLGERTIVAVASPTFCSKRWASFACRTCWVAVSWTVLVSEDHGCHTTPVMTRTDAAATPTSHCRSGARRARSARFDSRLATDAAAECADGVE